MGSTSQPLCSIMIFDAGPENSRKRSLPFCRDKGRTRGRAGALCLSLWQLDSSKFRGANRSYPNEDKHKAPSSTQPIPLSLQTRGCKSPDKHDFPFG